MDASSRISDGPHSITSKDRDLAGRHRAPMGKPRRRSPAVWCPAWSRSSQSPSLSPQEIHREVIASAAAEEELTRIRGGRMSEEYRGHLIRT